MIMNWVDLASVAVVLAGLIAGVRRGFFGELPRFLSMLIVLLSALRFYIPFAGALLAHSPVQGEDKALAIAFLLIVLTVSAMLAVIRLVLHLVLKIVLAVKGSRILGGLLGFCSGVMLAFIIVFGAGLWPGPAVQRVLVEESHAGQLARESAGLLVELLGSVRVTIDPAKPVDGTE